MSDYILILTPGRNLTIMFDNRQGEISLAYPENGNPKVEIKTAEFSDSETYEFTYDEDGEEHGNNENS